MRLINADKPQVNLMKSQKTLFALALLASAAVTGTAQASLVDRGNGLLYDNVLNVTWLQDANYAKTSSYDADGRMSWSAATTWAADLVYGGFSDWRLATNTPVSGTSFNEYPSYNGTTDSSYNITSPHSELSYMYYVNLGLKGFFDASGNVQSDYGIFGNGTFGQANVGLVNNLQGDYSYWSGAEYSVGPTVLGWFFGFSHGYQNYSLKYEQQYAWAVRSGDVSPVPVPGAVWLFGSALLGLLGLRRRGGNIG